MNKVNPYLLAAVSAAALATILNLVAHNFIAEENGEGTMENLVDLSMHDFADIGTIGQRFNPQSNAIDYKCLSTNEMTQLIWDLPQAYIASFPKTGGSSASKFSQRCTGSKNDLFRFDPGSSKEDQLTESFQMPSMLADHFMGEKDFISLMVRSSSTSLLMVTLRPEISRLRSSISYVTRLRIANPIGTTPNGGFQDKLLSQSEKLTKDHEAKYNGTHYIFDEEIIIDLVDKRLYETQPGVQDILTCKSYEAIQKTRPELVFIDYKRLNEIQYLLAEKHCPQLDLPIMLNVGIIINELNISISTRNNGEVSLDDWIDDKLDILTWTLGLDRRGPGCGGETKLLEEAIDNCPSGFIQAIGSGRVYV